MLDLASKFQVFTILIVIILWHCSSFLFIIIVSWNCGIGLIRTPYTQEHVNIGCALPRSKIRWFQSTSSKPRFINTVTFDSKEGCPTLVMLHGYGASLGFFFRNFDALAKHFRVIAIDLLGWVCFGLIMVSFKCLSPDAVNS